MDADLSSLFVPYKRGANVQFKFKSKKAKFKKDLMENLFQLVIFVNKYQTRIMRTLNVSISDIEFNLYGLKKDKLSFSELLDVVSRQLTKQALKNSTELAEKYDLAEMTMDEISNEVKAARQDAKSNS